MTSEGFNVPSTSRKGKIQCCVVGCQNAYYNTDSSIKFYTFPKKWFEKERRQIWINSVRRVCVDGTSKEWQPKDFHKICSAHFVGNVKSDEMESPSYNPTIFPEVYKKVDNSMGKMERYKRKIARSTKKDLPKDSVLQSPSVWGEENCLMEVDDGKKEFSCQTDRSDVEDDVFLFESNFVGHTAEGMCDVTTQCNIGGETKLFIGKDDKCVGIDEPIECSGFHGFKSLKSDEHLNCLAGMVFDKFNFLCSILTNSGHGNLKLSLENRLLLFLMKIKLGLSFVSLGVLFQLHSSSCQRIFTSLLEELVQKTSNFIFWPSREAVDNTMPKAFELNYPKCRAIIDCTEIKIQQPKGVDQRIHTYSQYKSTFTAKFLIAVAPSGFISFVSKCYGGRSSDTFITNDCGFLELLEPNDVILADKGFPHIKCKEDVILVLPPFVHDGQLSLEEVEETYTVASVRIHVERCIQRIKIHKILHEVPYNLFKHLDDIVRICCVLTNMQPPIIANCEDKME